MVMGHRSRYSGSLKPLAVIIFVVLVLTGIALWFCPSAHATEPDLYYSSHFGFVLSQHVTHTPYIDDSPASVPSFPKPDANNAPPGLPDGLKLSPEDQAKVDATPAPLSAIAVTNCGMAIALFIQLDADHLFRADPRQSDMFTAVKGKMVQSTAPPMEWRVAYALAEKAILSSHVVTPCTDGPQV